MNTQQIRDEIRTTEVGERCYGGDPIPDTIDAAVGVIEGAGYTVATTHWDYIDKVYRMRALTSDARPFVEVVSDPIEQETAECVQQAYRKTLWQLALACVKAGKGKGDGN